MADKKLQALQRAWKASGGGSSEAEYVSEALRQQALDRTYAELAAYCGRAGALAALGRPEVRDTPEDDTEWCAGLVEWDQRVQVLFAIEVAERALEAWDVETKKHGLPPEARTAPRHVLKVLRDWLAGDESAKTKLYETFDSRNAYPYFMPDYGFNDRKSKLAKAGRHAVGYTVAACNLLDDPEGAEEWLEDLSSAPSLGEAKAALGLWALSQTK